MKQVLQWMLCLAVALTAASAQGQTTSEPPGGAMVRFRADRCQPNAGLLECEDMSGHGFTAVVQGHTPHVEQARVGTQPAIVSSREESLRFGSASTVIGSEFTAVVVGQYMGQNAFHLLLNPGASAAGSAMIRSNTAGKVKLNYSPPAGGSGAVELTASGWNGTAIVGLSVGQPFIAVVVGSSAGVSLYVDNTLMETNANPAWPLSLYGTVADGQFVTAGQTALTVAEALVYNRALSQAELDRLHSYAKRRYALSYQSDRWQNGANLAVGGNFDTGLSPWSGQKASAQGTPTAAPELISHHTADTANGSAGALRLNVMRQSGFIYRSHQAGAICPLSTVVPAGATLRIQFMAKRISGAPMLGISRLGGGEFEHVQLTTSWQQYEAFVYLSLDTSSLVFSTISKKAENYQDLVNGELLLDDVKVSVVERGYANLAVNGYFEYSNPAPWYGQKVRRASFQPSTSVRFRFPPWPRTASRRDSAPPIRGLPCAFGVPRTVLNKISDLRRKATSIKRRSCPSAARATASWRQSTINRAPRGT